MDAKEFIIIPSQVKYAAQMEALQRIAYQTLSGEECFTADMFCKHLEIFPEGQFSAIETETDRVVGVTVSMRMQFNPEHPHAEPWMNTVDYG